MDDGFASLIMVDDIDWDSAVGPTHIVSYDENNKMIFIPVFIGKPTYSLKDSEYTPDADIGIYCKGEDYDKINHSLSYIFLHNPHFDQEWFEEGVKNLSPEWIEEQKEIRSISRSHVHLTVPDTDVNTFIPRVYN